MDVTRAREDLTLSPAPAAEAASAAPAARGAGATLGFCWESLLDAPPWDDVLTWPPDVVALTARVLEASEAYRFVVSSPPGRTWDVEPAASAQPLARQWCEWLDGAVPAPPHELVEAWEIVLAARDAELADIADGSAWTVVQALVLLLAAADEACAGLGVGTHVAAGCGYRFRGMARELLVETGSLSRVSPDSLHVLPKARAALAGISIKSLTRHVCVEAAKVRVHWRKALWKPTGERWARGPQANVLLLPWPLHVEATDFKTRHAPLTGMDQSVFGFFEFSPAERLDLSLLHRTLEAAEHEAGAVDAVIFPEAALRPDDIPPLQQALSDHGVWSIIAGVAARAPHEGALGRNYVLFSIRQQAGWRDFTQDKHHRWRLDETQIEQYNLASTLHPGMQWWEAIDIPRRTLQVMDVGAGMTIVPLVCEDLARLEPVANVVRSIGPTLVTALLLDGPQLSSRWTSRYASVLADDPGCAVCTLTSYGFVQRCRPPGLPASDVVALWKDPKRGLCEIALEPGATAVLITTTVDTSDSWTADGRHHVGQTVNLTISSTQQVRPQATATRSSVPQPRSERRDQPLTDDDVTKVGSWAEVVAEAALCDPAHVVQAAQEATSAGWRRRLGLPPASEALARGTAALAARLEQRGERGCPLGVIDVFAVAALLERDEEAATSLTGFVLRLALEERLVSAYRGGVISLAQLSALLGAGPDRPRDSAAGASVDEALARLGMPVATVGL